MGRALAGITVVDFSHVVAGPRATHFLALNGARVIKVEPPRGDALRNYTLHPGQRGMAPAFAGINVGKQSVVLDLKTDAGKAAAMKLTASADIVVENFRPGVMDRLGLGYAAVQAENPGVVYCSVSGFGQSGELAQTPAIDQIVQSLSGLMNLSGNPGDPAMRVGIPIVDTFTGLLAAFAIQTALVQRERGQARGQHIDVAMLDAALVMMLAAVNPLLIAGEAPQRTGNRGFSRAPTADTFATAKGEITIGAVEDAQVARLLDVLGLGDLGKHPDYADRMSRARNADAMRAELARAFATRSAADWQAAFQAAGVPAAQVLSVEESLALPHLEQRNIFMTVGAGRRDAARVLNAGFQFLEGGPGTDMPAPELGEHTDTILRHAGAATTRARA